tara:strand:- start:598 stop:1833 length:1236 start_codon:yes stop_codon:yes gene_type:complete
MNVKPCVIGLGYVGLPLILNLSKKFDCIGFDINKKRVKTLRKRIDLNNEFNPKDFLNKKLYFTYNPEELIKSNFFIICVPTPVTKDKKPDLDNLNQAIKIVSKKLKKNDIIFIESTIFPGLTEKYKLILEKKSGLKENKDFFLGYSPERVNPGDKIHTINNINKIVSIETNNSIVKRKIFSVYKLVSKKIIYSKSIKSAETAKVIENIQRDLNIALMNEILLICKKLKIDFKEVIRLAETKWNFMKFNPGLVGGHCLPVDPYYLSSIAKKNKIDPLVILSGRKVNDEMINFILKELKEFLKLKNKRLSKSRILLIGLSYKPGIADMRNSINFKIYKFLIKYSLKVLAYDPFVVNEFKIKYGILDKIDKKNNFDAILFLSKSKKFEKEFKKLNTNKNKFKIIDPFEYYIKLN